MVEGIMKKLGVAERERFDTYKGSSLHLDNVYFADGILYDGHGDAIYATSGNIVCGKTRVVIKPFMPKLNDDYYYVSASGSVLGESFKECTSSYAFLLMGNCFRTSDQAFANKDKILAKFEEIKAMQKK